MAAAGTPAELLVTNLSSLLPAPASRLPLLLHAHPSDRLPPSPGGLSTHIRPPICPDQYLGKPEFLHIQQVGAVVSGLCPSPQPAPISHPLPKTYQGLSEEAPLRLAFCSLVLSPILLPAPNPMIPPTLGMWRYTHKQRRTRTEGDTDRLSALLSKVGFPDQQNRHHLELIRNANSQALPGTC